MKLVFQEDKEKYVNETYARMLSLSTVLRTTSLKKKKIKIWRRNSRNSIINFWPKKIITKRNLDIEMTELPLIMNILLTIKRNKESSKC